MYNGPYPTKGGIHIIAVCCGETLAKAFAKSTLEAVAGES